MSFVSTFTVHVEIPCFGSKQVRSGPHMAPPQRECGDGTERIGWPPADLGSLACTMIPIKFDILILCSACVCGYIERFRINPIAAKATFILRTFFTEGGEFCLTREDFPAQFDVVRPSFPVLRITIHCFTRYFALLM